MSSGYVKVYRSLLDHEIIRDSEALAVWLFLLLNATYKPYGSFFNGHWVILQPGQLITGRKSISEKTGVGESKVRRVLKRLKRAQQIDQQTSNTSSLITVLSWDRYQSSGQQADQPEASQRPTDGQPEATNNKSEVENKEPSMGSIYCASESVAHSTSGSDRGNPTSDAVARYAAENDVAPAVAAEFYAYYEALRWHTKKTGESITNWKRLLKSWVKRQEEQKEATLKAKVKADATTSQAPIIWGATSKVKTKPTRQVHEDDGDQDDYEDDDGDEDGNEGDDSNDDSNDDGDGDEDGNEDGNEDGDEA